MASPISLSPTTSLRLRLLEPPATTNPRFTAFYADTSPEGVDTIQGGLDGTSPVIAVPAPTSGRRIVSNLIVQNRDTAAFGLVLETLDGATAAEVFQVFLQVGDYLSGGNVYDQYGSIKAGTTGPQGIPGPQGDRGNDGLDGTDGLNGTDGADGITPGLAFFWSNSTSLPLNSGEIALNNADYALATLLLVHESDLNGANISAVFDAIQPGALVQIQSAGDSAKYAWFSVTTIADNGSNREISVSYLTSLGSFAEDERVSLAFFRKGVDGVDGVNGTGAVNTINGVAPNMSGEVTLQASNVGAEAELPNPPDEGYFLTSSVSGVKSWIPAPGGTRVSTMFASSNLSAGGRQITTATLAGKTIGIFHIALTGAAATIRIYGNSASQAADLRSDLTDPVPNGVLLLAQATLASGAATASAISLGVNADNTNVFPITVDSQSGGVSTFTIDYLVLEV